MDKYCCPKCGQTEKFVVALQDAAGVLACRGGEGYEMEEVEGDERLTSPTTCPECGTSGPLMMFDPYAEHLLNPEQLRDRYVAACAEGVVVEHPIYTQASWRAAVAMKLTGDGYWNYVLSQIVRDEQVLSTWLYAVDAQGERMSQCWLGDTAASEFIRRATAQGCTVKHPHQWRMDAPATRRAAPLPSAADQAVPLPAELSFQEVDPTSREAAVLVVDRACNSLPLTAVQGVRRVRTVVFEADEGPTVVHVIDCYMDAQHQPRDLPDVEEATELAVDLLDEFRPNLAPWAPRVALVV